MIWRSINTNVLLLSGLLALGTAQAEVIPVYQLNAGEGTYVEASLTHDIYRYSASTQLNDLVIIDKLGNKLPYSIGQLTPGAANHQLDSNPVHFFPVALGAPPEALLTLSSASIRIDNNQISVSAEKKDNSHVNEQGLPIEFYVVDISERRKRLDALIIDWQPSEANQLLEVEVSGTNDLQNWQKINQSTLVQLQKNDHSLTRNRIELQLPEQAYAYLRLKFLRGGEQLVLEKITAQNSDQQLNAQPQDQWELSGQLAEDQKSFTRTNGATEVAAWEFERSDQAPLQTLSLQLGQLSYGDKFALYSRNSSKKAWRPVAQGIWFNAQVGSDWQHSDPINLPQNSDSYWRLELNELVRSQVTPILQFSRPLQRLQFIANNNSPYQIAINDTATSDNRSISTAIFNQLLRNKELAWVSVELVELNPDINSFARQVARVSWMSFLFWGVLLLAVGMLVWVAVRLVGQMKAAQ